MELFEPMVRKLCSGQEMLKSLPEACIPSLESFGPMMTKLRSGQGKRDNADADTDANDATDQSNTYMSPETATQKGIKWTKICKMIHKTRKKASCLIF